MVPIMNVGGSPIISQREYAIASATAIKTGQVVKLTAGLIVAAAAAETGQLLGIAAENHSGTADALDPRANGTKIMVYDAPDLMFECPAPVITATAGTATTVVTNASGGMAAFTADSFNGGWLKLLSKVTASTNTDAVGAQKLITDFADSSGTETFTVASAGTANAGDTYSVYPPIGAKLGNLDATIQKLTLSATAAISVKTVGYDFDREMLRMMIVTHTLGGEE